MSKIVFLNIKRHQGWKILGIRRFVILAQLLCISGSNMEMSVINYLPASLLLEYITSKYSRILHQTLSTINHVVLFLQPSWCRTWTRHDLGLLEPLLRMLIICLADFYRIQYLSWTECAYILFLKSPLNKCNGFSSRIKMN